jgi:hypothetical protein
MLAIAGERAERLSTAVTSSWTHLQHGPTAWNINYLAARMLFGVQADAFVGCAQGDVVGAEPGRDGDAQAGEVVVDVRRSRDSHVKVDASGAGGGLEGGAEAGFGVVRTTRLACHSRAPSCQWRPKVTRFPRTPSGAGVWAFADG